MPISFAFSTISTPTRKTTITIANIGSREGEKKRNSLHICTFDIKSGRLYCIWGTHCVLWCEYCVRSPYIYLHKNTYFICSTIRNGPFPFACMVKPILLSSICCILYFINKYWTWTEWIVEREKNMVLSLGARTFTIPLWIQCLSMSDYYDFSLFFKRETTF